MNRKLISSILLTISVFLIGISNSSVIGQTNNLITKSSVGNVKLGMTVGEARKALPKSYKFGPAGGSEGVVFLGIFDGKKLLMEIGEYGEDAETNKSTKIDESQKIESISIHDSRYKTAEGIHVGMSIADVEKKYGKLKGMFNYPHQGETGEFTNQPSNMGFDFKVKGNSSTAGIYEEVPNCESTYPPACSKATKYNSGSYIASMSIMISPPAQKIVSIKDVPKNLKVQIYGPTECVDDLGEVTYSLWTTKGNTTDYQEFKFKGLMPCPEKRGKSQNVSIDYKKQFDVFFGDYNFDGNTDLALRDGMNGGYGFPSYQIYLFSKAKNKYVKNPSYTELGQYQGMFDVDKKNKMIYNRTKSGCCFYQTDGYKVVNDKLVKIYEKITDYNAPGATEDKPKITIKKIIDGKWKTM